MLLPPLLLLHAHEWLAPRSRASTKAELARLFFASNASTWKKERQVCLATIKPSHSWQYGVKVKR